MLLLAPSLAFASQPDSAMFYGANPPWDELRAFDVVVEPLHAIAQAGFAGVRTLMLQ